mgnify:CR=1 FL=1
MLSFIFVLGTEYVKATIIVLLSSSLKISNLSTFIFVKFSCSLFVRSSFKVWIELFEICSNIKALKPPPNSG